jgi:hypothetical protein
VLLANPDLGKVDVLTFHYDHERVERSGSLAKWYAAGQALFH